MTKSTVVILSILIFLCIQCAKEKDTTFLIHKDAIGKLKRNTVVDSLDRIYAKDSIIKDTSKIQLSASGKKINIYEKGGNHLLTLTPSADSIPVIENVRIYDSRYLTADGIGIKSTFKEIREKYTILKTVTTLNNVVVYLKENDMYFAIDKKELPSNLRYGSNTSIEQVQIPDVAKIKYLMIGWQ